MKNKEESIIITVDKLEINGDLVLPAKAKSIVIFAHGSGSGRNSPRNRYVANFLQEKNMATLLFDLLSAKEERVDMMTAHLRFDIQLLAGRLNAVKEWTAKNPATQNLDIGYFGASTGAAAALVAAAESPEKIKAIVSRGGRPDLAGKLLLKVKAPTLLIVGGDDSVVIDLNNSAFEKLKVEKKMEIIPGAGHLFEEPGKLEEVAKFAREWFLSYLNEY